MIIENRTVVTLSYRLTIDENGSEVEVEKTDSKNPFVFIFGTGGLLPEFEKNLSGKTIGDQFDFRIAAENGYGISDVRNVMNVPITIFEDEEGNINEEILFEGNILPMSDQNGNRYSGKVKEVKEEVVIMDFNHPLADKELHFIGEVVNVRLASLEELSHGHVHGPGGHHH